MTAAITVIPQQFEMEVKEGLKFILNHLDNLWPRMISTYTTGGAQKPVENLAEAMAWFRAANFLDCRISAYPIYTDSYVQRTGIAPTVLLADIDKEHFKTPEEFELAATRNRIRYIYLSIDDPPKAQSILIITILLTIVVKGIIRFITLVIRLCIVITSRYFGCRIVDIMIAGARRTHRC